MTPPLDQSDYEKERTQFTQQTLIEHLVELKKRVVWAALFVFLGFGACWFQSEKLFDLVRHPIKPYLKTASQGLIFTAPLDKFMAHLKVSFLAGFILTAPLWLYQVWKFIAPGLYKKERRASVAFMFSGTVLFLMGAAFVYFLVLPTAFHFLLSFGGSVDTPMITISDYLSFFITMTLVFGLAFEMPLVLVILGMLGVIDDKFLRKNRRYAIVVIAIVSAVITPPDALSMMMMLVPLLLLYEISIWVVRALQPKPSAVAATA